MDRREAILRELNLYPQWVRRGQTAPLEAGHQLPFVPTAEAIIPKDSEVAVPLESAVIEQQSRPSTQVEKLDWPELKQQVQGCTACKLRAGCTQTVFGVGDEKADWLFVGEGPGADEDTLGEPFVGQAGKLLDNMLMAIKLKRGKNVYIANIVKCRPPGNRTPAADEIAQCLPYLERQIALIQPRLIVALGKVAANALLGRDATIASLRGMLHDYHVATAPGLDVSHERESSHLSSIPHQTTSSHRVRTTIPLIVTYHPAYLLRSPSEKAKAWQDLCFAVRSLHGEA
jgi:uracil-DNA glycosylase